MHARAAASSRPKRETGVRTRVAATVAFAALSLATAALAQQPSPAPSASASDREDAIRAEISRLRDAMNRGFEIGIVHLSVQSGEQALELAVTSLGEQDILTLGVMNDLGNLYIHQGRYAEAESLRLHVLAEVERLLGPDHPDTLVAVVNMASLYRYQQRNAEAEPLYRRALAGLERTLGPDNSSTIVTLTNLASLYQAQGRAADAEPLFERALEASERTLGADHPHTLNLLASLAGIYFDQERYAEAEPLYVRALETNSRLRLATDPNRLSAMTSLGAVYERQERFAEAETQYSTAAGLSEFTYGSDHPDTIARTERLAALRLRWPNARESALEPARLIASGLRSRWAAVPHDVISESQFERERGQRASGFTLLADAAWTSRTTRAAAAPGLANEAFTALQDSMAGSTSRAVVRMAVRRAAEDFGTGLGTLTREREALEDAWQLNSRRQAEALATPSPQVETLRSERRRIEERMAAIDSELRRGFPQYFALVRPEALALADAQALLGSDEAILLVVPTQFGTHVVALSRNAMEWVRSDWTDRQVDEAVSRLLGNLRRMLDSRGEIHRYDRSTAHDLYAQIVAPVSRILEGKRHVFVAAAGSLSSLPFGILVTEAPLGDDSDTEALRTTRWLADAYPLIQIPSIQSLQFLRRAARPGPAPVGTGPRFLGLGNPRLEGPADEAAAEANCARGGSGSTPTPAAISSRTAAPSGRMIADVAALRRLCPLPGTSVELERMRVALGAPASSLIVAENFTEPHVREIDLSHARVLAFATHGAVAGELRASTEPGLVLTPPDTATEENDGYLAASEVSTLRLNADWVILSACNTASGDGSAGAPGLSGLARAFFYAGARNLLVSHWKVLDDVGPRLTVRAIQLSEGDNGLSYAEALQRAMREVREDRSNELWAHPAVWAPFSLVGDGAR